MTDRASQHQQPNLIPTHIITGFLGAGKTTTINALLGHLRGLDESVLVVINEMGAVNIDAHLLDHPQRGILSLSGGCMCCALRVLLETRLAAVLRRWRPDRILIEPTGVGHPRDLLNILQRGPLARALAVGPHTVVIDPSLHAQASLRQHPLYQDQWAIAQWVAISKRDVSDGYAVQAVVDAAAADGKGLGDGGLAAARSLLLPPHHQPGHVQTSGAVEVTDQPSATSVHGYEATFLSPQRPDADIDGLLAELSERLPTARCKGLVAIDGVTHVVQLVGREITRKPLAGDVSQQQLGLTVIVSLAEQAAHIIAECAARYGFALKAAD